MLACGDHDQGEGLWIWGREGSEHTCYHVSVHWCGETQ